MTNHWRDIRHADLILINGANPAEAHPVGFQWMMRAKLDRGAKMIHADPRFTRTSAVADKYLRIRTGTDVAYFGGLINYVLQNDLFHREYVEYATNAGLVVKEGYAFNEGLFNGFDEAKKTYNTAQWTYEIGPDGYAIVDIAHPRSVLNLMREHYSRYTPEMVERITGIPRAEFLEVAKLVGETGKPDKVMTIVYAVGLTHHTTGVQLIRSGALLQLLLGNMGRPGGGMNAERGHANIQGNTDHAISWDILPGYLRVPAPGQRTIADYVAQSASKKLLPNSLNFFGENYRKFMVSLLKSWYGDAATPANEFAFNYVPKPASNASWLTIFDQALRGKMEGLLLSGMTATSIGPDSNQVLQALSNLKWLVVMDAFPTTSSEFWTAPGIDASNVQTEVFLLPTTHWIEKDGSFTNSGRWAQWKEQVLPPEGEARHDHWIMAELFQRVKDLYRQGGTFPEPLVALTMPYQDPRKPTLDEIAQEINGKDLTTGKRLATFGALKDDGTTTAGDWIYTGHYPEAGNLAKRRDGIQDPAKNDPTGMGFYPNWAWSWPLNRRVLYNRASADPLGRPWDPDRAGIEWDATAKQWVGDVPDYPPTADPSQPGVSAAVHHDRGGHRTSVQQRRRGWSVPRALRADRVAGRQPAAPGRVGHAGGLPVRLPGRTAQPVRIRGRLPVRRDLVPVDRARALRHPAHRATGEPAAGGVCRDTRGTRPREGHRDRRPRPGLVQARQARGTGGGDQASRPAPDRRKEDLSDRHPDSLGIRRHQLRSALARQRAHPVRGRRQLTHA